MNAEPGKQPVVEKDEQLDGLTRPDTETDTEITSQN
jgi:hypothetical protein